MYNLALISSCIDYSPAQSNLTANDLITAGISIATLLLNILFYTLVAPKMSFRFQRKSDFLKWSSKFMEYLSKVNSFSNFEGVPTKVKSYCVSIELLFKTGVAPDPLRTSMETIYQDVKKRKEMKDPSEIENWNQKFKDDTHTLRRNLAKYTGIF